MPAMLGLLVGKVSQGAVFAYALAAAGHLSLSKWWRNCIGMVGLQALIAPAMWVLSRTVSNDGLLIVAIGAVASVELALLWALRKRSAFGRLAAAYSLPGFGGN